MYPTAKDIGKYLESQARIGTPITYGQLIKQFPSLPPLGPHWKSHPLCSIFGELDREDHNAGRPFRTSLVCAVGTNRPGQGFFDTISELRGQTILKSDEEKVWIGEVTALFALSKQSSN